MLLGVLESLKNARQAEEGRVEARASLSSHQVKDIKDAF